MMIILLFWIILKLLIRLIIVSSAFRPDIFELRIFRKQLLYLYKIVIKSVYILPYLDLTYEIRLDMLSLLLLI